MVIYNSGMKTVTGRECPTEREIGLFNRIVHICQSISIGDISIKVSKVNENDLYKVFYNKRIVFTFTYGVRNSIVLYVEGPWEDVIFKLFR